MAPILYASCRSTPTASVAAALPASRVKRSRSFTPACRARALRRSFPKPFSLASSAYAARWKAQNRPCRPAAQEARAAASDASPKIGKLRHSMRRVPSSTYLLISSGSVSRANFPQ